jgi:hemolysin activation/secretion protein
MNPSKGRVFTSKIYLGQRKLTSDSSSNTTFSGHLNYREYVPLFKRHVLVFAGVFDFYSSPVIYQNELFRFGGLNTLRGFNEEELFASVKAQATIEYRFLLDKGSNVFVFFDQCMYENNALDYVKDHPFGFGGGISFGSKIGVFNITYALGKKFSNPIDFRSSKIHFGYTAYF